MTFGEFIKSRYPEGLKTTTFSRLQLLMIREYTELCAKEAALAVKNRAVDIIEEYESNRKGWEATDIFSDMIKDITDISFPVKKQG